MEVISPIIEHPRTDAPDADVRQCLDAPERTSDRLFVDAARGTPLSYRQFSYVPVAHYETALDTAHHDGGTAAEGGDTAYFWYDTETNAVLQAAVGPAQTEALFHWQADAIDFLTEYAAHDGLDDVSHLDLYEATLDRQGAADAFVADAALEAAARSPTSQYLDDWDDQAYLDDFR